MARFQAVRPLTDVRLRSWPRGRIAEMKLLVSRLESSLNEMGAGAVKESAERRFNDEIPFVLDSDLTIDPGYRNFVINWKVPPGIRASTHPDRQLLFFEFQHSSTAAFAEANTIIIDTPQTHLMIGGVRIGEIRFFRVRTINTKFQASRWTKTFTSTAARGKIIQESISSVSVRMTEPLGVFQTIFTKSFNAVGGAIMVMAQTALGAFQEDVDVNDGGNKIFTFNSGPGFVQIRWLLDGKEFSQRSLLSARPGYTGNRLGNTPLAYGTTITEAFRPGTRTIEIKLQAALIRGSEWKGGRGDAGGGDVKQANPLFFSRNAKVIEVLEDF